MIQPQLYGAVVKTRLKQQLTQCAATRLIVNV